MKTKQSSSVRIPSANHIPIETVTSKKAMLIGLNNIGNTCYMYYDFYIGTQPYNACSIYLNSMITS